MRFPVKNDKNISFFFGSCSLTHKTEEFLFFCDEKSHSVKIVQYNRYPMFFVSNFYIRNPQVILNHIFLSSPPHFENYLKRFYASILLIPLTRMSFSKSACVASSKKLMKLSRNSQFGMFSSFNTFLVLANAFLTLVVQTPILRLCYCCSSFLASSSKEFSSSVAQIMS